MAVRAVVWLGGALFVVALAVCAWSYAAVWGRSAATVDPSALVFDAALFATFAIHHSLFARASVKRLFGSLSPQMVRSIYVFAASALLILACAAWRPIGGELYRAEGVVAAAAILGQLAGIWFIARAVAHIDPLELAGIRPETQRALQQSGVYGWVRHPLYLGWAIAVFATPHMTGDRLAFAAISTLYLVAAVPFEERSLRRSFGDDYARYARAVRWRIVPFIY